MKDVEVKPRIEAVWKQKLAGQFNSEAFKKLKAFLLVEKERHTVYPPGPEIFRAFDMTPFAQVRVVILGQDPYHGPGQAEGLCFSVKQGLDFPPSLRNIFVEIQKDLDLPWPAHGSLQKWARQGVLLLNAVLTVRAGQAASHRNHGWETFTNAAITALNREKESLVFLLWGSFARSKKQLIDTDRHLVLEAPHPSPLSAHRGFFGCRHFSKTNEYLQSKGLPPIDWTVD